LQLQNQFIDLSECESDGNESNTDISAKRGDKPGQSGDKPTKAEAGIIVERSKDVSNPKAKETHKIISQIWTNRKIKANPNRQNKGNLKPAAHESNLLS
jgi:hypothetical protein